MTPTWCTPKYEPEYCIPYLRTVQYNSNKVLYCSTVPEYRIAYGKKNRKQCCT